MEQSIDYIFDVQSSERVNLKSIIQRRTQNLGIWRGPNMFDISRLAKISILCYLINNMTQIVTLFKTKEDPQKLFACFSVLSFTSMGFLKLCSLLGNHKRWRRLIANASLLETELLTKNTSALIDSDDEEDQFSKHIELYTKKFLSISSYLVRYYTFTLVVFIASPFIEYTIYVLQGRDINELPHILLGWAPLEFSLLGYVVTVLAEVVTSVYCVRVHLAFDLVAVGLMIFVCGQFSLLHAHSERIGGIGKNLNLSKRRDDHAHFRIQQCHHIHVTLLKSVNELGNLIQNILGIYFFLAAFTLCSVAIQLKWKEQMSVAQLISLFQYMCGTLTQLFLFCYYGDAVFNKSSVTPGQGPFAAACWCVSPKIRREIALLCVGMSRPCIMRAGPFNSLDLPSFIQIVRAAYSYYAVIRQTSE